MEKKITPDDKTAFEGLLTELECTNVVYRLKKNKSPELDGLCNECYKKFWDCIKGPVIASLNKGYKKNEFSSS